MLKYIKKNKLFIAALILFALLFMFGNNMEFYDNLVKTCKSVKPDNFPNYKEPFLDASDDVIVQRRDQKQLEDEKINKFKYDGLDNWNILSDVNKGWWGSHIKAGGLYPAPKDLVWAD